MGMRFPGVAGAALMVAVPAFAHHRFAMFDYNKEIAKGTKTQDDPKAHTHHRRRDARRARNPRARAVRHVA